ncbi:hypothetical protein [uncultured Ruminococcus sp.]|uniref:hypothetical protein n=1 Tax=uncultured Ruminococcus sp. TaxID=165186 RepID=UPI0025F331DD|nr:hypothetical protein [uncultured Ruminococcus sp.]
MTPNEYRKKHRRCTTCDYCHDIVMYNDEKTTVGQVCTVKNKPTKLNNGRFCRVYKPKEFKV